jgi:hypothetical protein
MQIRNCVALIILNFDKCRVNETTNNC